MQFHTHGRVDAIVDDAYARAMQSGRYDLSEIHGRHDAAKHYAATNAHEYFAESCEAFCFSRTYNNDYFVLPVRPQRAEGF